MSGAPDTGGGRSPRRGRPSLKEAGQVVDIILDEASRLFIQRGYEATSVEAIAAAAGISKRTYYTRFTGKADVFEAVILRYVRRNVRARPSRRKRGEGLEAALLELAFHLLDWILQPEVVGLYRVTIAEVTRFPELARMVAEYAVNDAMRSFEPVFRAYLPDTVSDEDISFMSTQFMQAIGAELFHRAVQGMDRPGLTTAKRTQVRRAVALFLSGVSSRS